jgi:hypothetical protein
MADRDAVAALLDSIPAQHPLTAVVEPQTRIDARLRTLLVSWTDSHRNAEVGHDLDAATDEELISLLDDQLGTL